MLVRLTTTGRKSGELRTVPIYVWPDGDDFVLVGSNGGNDADPAWVGNLRATPTRDLDLSKADQTCRAREIHGYRTSSVEPGRSRPTRSRTTGATSARRIEPIPLFMLEPIAED